MRIPRLTFSLSAILGIIAAFFLANAALFGASPWIIKSGIKKWQRHSSMGGNDLKVPSGLVDGSSVDDIAGSKEELFQDIQNENHLSGTYTVKVRPWATAQLNPDGRPLCMPVSNAMPNSAGLSEAIKYPLSTTTSPSVVVPLVVTGTGPWTVTINRNGKFFKQITVKGNVTTSKALSDVLLDQPGIYRISKIVDGDGSLGKIDDSMGPLQISPCPQARLDGLLLQHNVLMCSTTTFPIKVWLSGTAPFTLTFDAVSDKGTEQVILPDIHPSKDIESGVFHLFTYDLPGRNNISQYLLRVSSVKDSTGRLHQYGSWDSGDATIVNLVQPPRVSWKQMKRNSASLEVVKLRTDQKFVPLPVSVTGTGPFGVSVEKPEGKIIDLDEFAENEKSVMADLPGTYKLLNVKDSVCRGSVDTIQEVSVVLVHPPTLQANATPIKSPCDGDMGLIFDFSLSGEGPWKVFADQKIISKKSNNIETKERLILDIPTPRFQYTWKPSFPGTYLLSFTSLSDANYKETKLTGYQYQQEIVPAPEARLVANADLFTCRGQSISVPVKFLGTAPWTLTYSISTPNASINNFEFESSSQSAEFKVVDFNVPGRYILSLVSIKDGSGCVSSPTSQILSITVHAHAPSVSFNIPSSGLFKVRKGTDDVVPITVSANKLPVILELKNINDPSAGMIKLSLETFVRGIKIQQPGSWEIVSVKDQHCIGSATSPSKVDLIVLSSPTVTFDANSNPWTCRRSPSVLHPLKLNVVGNGIISVAYTVQYALEEREFHLAKKEKHIASGNGPSLVISPSKETILAPGFYKYQVESISDSSFPERKIENLFFTQQVLPDPAPRFTLFDQNLAFCYDGSEKSIGKVPMDFTGSEMVESAPFNVSFDLYMGQENLQSHQSTIIEKIPGIFSLPSSQQGPGEYNVKVTKVENAFGCIWTSPASQSLALSLKEQSALALQSAQRPSIKLEEINSNLCVGDVARFHLDGSGPFTVTFTLHSAAQSKPVKKIDTVQSNRFTVLLAESGSIVINSVCNKFCCAVLPSEGLNYPIYSLPTASITEGIKYMHEGEEASFSVALKGVPPFAFSYQRIDENDGHIIETVDVKNVNETHHHVKVLSGGTFKVVYVQDQYCKFPKKR